MASGQPETEAEVQAGQAGLARGRETGGGQEIVFVSFKEYFAGEGHGKGGGAVHGDADPQHLRGVQPDPGLR